ncbi:MAG: hypothetical protein HOW73_39375 [Polyangiaceae bacterium]|nr:hypothetical protein [Polyangiaceae bacterium]
MARPGPSHAYPRELSSFVLSRLEELGVTAQGLTFPEDSDVVESVLSVAYQVSLLRDEDRTLTFRLAIASPDAFDPNGWVPRGVHPLKFTVPRPFAVHELRKLATAVKFPRSVIGAYVFEDRLLLWGMLHTGPRWLQTVRGGRGGAPELPSVLLIHVNGPGNLVVNLGSRTLARLYAGELTIPMLDVFESQWLAQSFAPVRGEVAALYGADGEGKEGWPALDLELVRRIGQSFTRRIISTIRGARHGGTLLVVQPQCLEDMCKRGLVELKYRFEDSEPRRRFRTLLSATLRQLGEEKRGKGSRIGWEDYEASTTPATAQLDEGIMEMAYLVSALADVDGLVVMTHRFELIGFGGIISGKLEEVPMISQALDLEGATRIEEQTDGMGTRHRAAYRLVASVHDAICIVVSQDGGVRFVRWHDGGVVYWDQVAAQTFG